jgi:hypothetical protein
MNNPPGFSDDYTDRQTEAARRVLVDIGQILGGFRESMVIVGGWVPDLLLSSATETHIGSIDVDIALDAQKLTGNLYADLLDLLLETRRFQLGDKEFRLVSTVDLKDGADLIDVEVDFLASSEFKIKGKGVFPGFRVLQADACELAFRAPVDIPISGLNTSGSRNTVHLRVASLPDFLVMKAHALGGRDKPKDAYDFCYCLDHFPAGAAGIAQAWKSSADPAVANALSILREKFETIDSFGPRQAVAFHSPASKAEGNRIARRAFELVQVFLQEFTG